jgi:amidophosphoribosyltransferase
MPSEELNHLLNLRPRVEKIAVKDVKMRTFITDDAARDEMVSHVYDITYDSINRNTDTLVMIDDSIVRGTTLQKSILSILDRLGPKKIVVVSSAPQIRYPDCYGIDMSKMHDFIAFRALLALLKDRELEYKIDEVYQKCKTALQDGTAKEKNYVKELYNLFTDDEISDKIGEIVRPEHIFSQVKVIYQSVEELNKACPKNLGDWYFTGNYPTPGGYRVVNRAFVFFVEGKNERAY